MTKVSIVVDKPVLFSMSDVKFVSVATWISYVEYGTEFQLITALQIPTFVALFEGETSVGAAGVQPVVKENVDDHLLVPKPFVALTRQ